MNCPNCGAEARVDWGYKCGSGPEHTHARTQRCWEAQEGNLEQQLDAAQDRIRRLEEDHVMQLAAISAATWQNTESTILDRIDRTSPYWTTAYGDVCVTVDREMNLRAQRDRYEVALDKVVDLIGNHELWEALDVIQAARRDAK